MGRWNWLEMRWPWGIREKDVAVFSEVIGQFDHDWTGFGWSPGYDVHPALGPYQCHWRKPLLQLEHILAIAHIVTSPCEGRWVEYGVVDDFCDRQGCLGCAEVDWKDGCYTGDCLHPKAPRLSTIDRLLAEPWVASKPDLSTLPRWKVESIRKRTRRLDGWLPAKEPSWRKGGRSGSRALGERR